MLVRVGVLLALTVALATAVEVDRPVLHQKLNAKKARLGDAFGLAEAEKFEELKVAAAERESSLADEMNLLIEANARARTATIADTDEGVAAAASAAASAHTSGVTEQSTESEQSASLNVESLQSLEFTSHAFVPTSTKAILAKRKWSNCCFSTSRTVGSTRLTKVEFLSAPPIRDQSFILGIDGTYTGPDVTYGSVLVQIARNFGSGKYDLVYRHSLKLSDVLALSYPFKAGPLGATMYVPHEAFNMYSPRGDYVLTVTFTNQNRDTFACAKVDFNLA